MKECDLPYLDMRKGLVEPAHVKTQPTLGDVHGFHDRAHPSRASDHITGPLLARLSVFLACPRESPPRIEEMNRTLRPRGAVCHQSCSTAIEDPALDNGARNPLVFDNSRQPKDVLLTTWRNLRVGLD